MNLSKIDIIILKDLENKNKTNFLKSISLKELIVYQNSLIKSNSIYKRLNNLKNQGLVQLGAKDGKMNTYYITELGIQILNKL
nr:transcriptional regulator [uncultured Tyzzerella sp.]